MPTKPIIYCFPSRRAAFLLLLASSAPAFSQTPPPVDETAAHDETVQLSPFEVSAKGDHGYNTANTVGATMVNTAILDTPISIVVLNSEFLKDVGVVEPTEAAVYVSGGAGVAAIGSGQLTIRGQGVTGVTIRDGVQEITAPEDFEDTAFIDRLEIVKGPEGTLYGDYSGQGGLANSVTKSPQPQAATSLTAFYGADEMGGAITRGIYDATGPVPGIHNLEYRLVLVGQAGRTLQGGHDDQFLVSPMLKYYTPGGGSFLARFMHQNPDRHTNQYQWFADASGNLPHFIKANQSIADLDSGSQNSTTDVDIVFTQPFRTGPISWDSRLYNRYTRNNEYDILYEQANTSFLFLNAAGQVIGNIANTNFTSPGVATIEVSPRVRTNRTDFNESGSENLDFVGSFDVGPTKNKLLIYGNNFNERDHTINWTGAYPGIYLWTNQPNGPQPVHYDNEAAVAAVTGPVTETVKTHTLTGLMAAGAQENMSFLDDRVNLVAGIRNDRQAQTTYNFISNQIIPGDIRKGTTHHYGIVVRVIEPVSLFYNYSETFAPNGYGLDVNSVSYKLPNLDTSMNEEGAKLSLFHGALTVTGSYFKTVVANATVLVSEYNSLGQAIGVTVPVGQQLINGWEMDGTLAISRNFAMLFGAGNLSSKTATGFEARGVPFGTNYRGLGKYTFTDTFLKGGFIGLGLIHDGPRAADAAVDFILPPMTLLNGFVGYQVNSHFRVQVNVQNLTNLSYAAVSVARTIIYAGNPTNANCTLTYSY